jgi:hypothetical protein
VLDTVLNVFFTPGWGAILSASGTGTLAGVIVTNVFNVWNRRIDAKTRDADRQHERAMAYQQRVWQAKHDVLTRLICACRYVKWRATLTGAKNTDENHSGAVSVQALDEFRDRIGGEDLGTAFGTTWVLLSAHPCPSVPGSGLSAWLSLCRGMTTASNTANVPA